MTYPFFNELGFITITQKIISLLVIGVYLGSSILLYVESFGDRLLLMRTHEDLSSDMELLVYVFYSFVVIFYLAECHGIYEIDYITSILGGSCISKMVSMFYFLNIINLVSFQAWSRLMTSFQ